MTTTDAPEATQVLRWFNELSNWGRWGAGDRVGTLNLITTEKRAGAASLVTEGVTVSCAWDVDLAHPPPNTIPTELRVLVSGEELDDQERQPLRRLIGNPNLSYGIEQLRFVFHGYHITHLDSLAHAFWRGRMYNDLPASLVTEANGAQALHAADVATGIVTRGVLLDIAAARGVPWMAPGEGVFPADLAEAERRQGVTVGSGDAVLLRTGYGRLRRERPDEWPGSGHPGWHAACLPWIRERDVALIGCDTAQDARPSGYDDPIEPIHAVGLVAMGLWLLDNCNLEDLVATCARLSRWAFQFVLAPLRLVGVTGSPANPLAIF